MVSLSIFLALSVSKMKTGSESIRIPVVCPSRRMFLGPGMDVVALIGRASNSYVLESAAELFETERTNLDDGS